ncbi:type IV pilus modification PilV family protein [Mangrovihabitans endophyticus]|uniref:Uncharacterized protein n=1 Tax=Mangrovihabitans endophyticus TaxID=1751298 RepID=A0A8J3C837_9ACTN|nr:hypothetical protein [Mangrovihabitans endophyticus]GGL19183.1 hypothetical protein GCM10012284_62140 [Mangrovihabitans endophyticus]
MNRRDAGDAGYGLLEALVSVLIIGVTMTSLTMFFLRSTRAANLEADRQSATQLVAVALERIGQFPGRSLLTGRTRAAVDAQWALPVPGVQGYLADTVKAWDTTVTDEAAATVPAELPVVLAPVADAAGGGTFTKFRKTVYVGTCRQASTGGSCGRDTSGTVEMFRVVVAVTWASPQCRQQTCSSTAELLVARDLTDPLFR